MFFPPEFPVNHVLVNAYPRTGGLGIMPHTDGPAYHPITCTVSLGSAATLRFHRARNSDAKPPQQQPSGGLEENRSRVRPLRLSGRGSLAVFSHDLYSRYLHSIDRPRGEGRGEQEDENEGDQGEAERNDDGSDSDDSVLDLDLADLIGDGGRDGGYDDSDPDYSPPARISITLRHKYGANCERG
jgi:alkylated DNA repair protein alkB family protein 6